MEPHATALADAVEVALPRWVERSVTRIIVAWTGEAPGAGTAEAAREAGRRAAGEVGAQLRALLAADIDEQWTTPLSLLRAAVRYPTEVLQGAGVPPVERDPFRERLEPGDLYDLSPASFADVDPALAEPGLVWGAAKALAHRRRHMP
ncbi:MAG TPA: hypothetical protein VNT52_07690 [Acidimicrobiales bacterium]|nr:hypothetical protein [Acidimicrobiales bacterium]